MIIKNKKNTSKEVCICSDSWLEHWMNKSGESAPKYCCEKNCINKPEVGAHILVGGKVRTYIIPMCKKCNQKEGWFESEDITAVSDTCY